MDSLISALPPPRKGEYDVILANLDDFGQFFIRETYMPLYSTEFVDYERRPDGQQNPACFCQAFQERGDVVVAVDGILTKNKPFREVVSMIQASTNNKYMFLRMADASHNQIDIGASQGTASHQENKQELQDDITHWQHALEKKEEQLAIIRHELAVRKEALAQLDGVSQTNATCSPSSPTATTPTADKIPHSSRGNDSVRRSRRLRMKRNIGFVSPPPTSSSSDTEASAEEVWDTKQEFPLVVDERGNRKTKQRCV